MADEREQSMLELVLECERILRHCENTLNEIWAEWTRTHGLRGGVSQPKELTPDMDPAKAGDRQGSANAKVVKRTIKR